MTEENKISSLKQIVFHFSIKGIGGVQNLYLNLIKELYKRKIVSKLIYYNNTWLTNQLNAAGIQYELFDLEKDNIEELNLFIKREDILITTFEFYIENIYKIKPYIFYWVVFPRGKKNNNQKLLSKFFDLTLRVLIKKMNEKNGFYFMDSTCSKTYFAYYGMVFSEKYLPIPIQLSDYRIEKYSIKYSQVQNRKVAVSYIGRAEAWKVNPLKKIITDLSSVASKLNLSFTVHIITDNINEFVKLLSCESSLSIEIQFHSNLYGNSLADFLKNNIFINFAMGTSCLESAAVGVPSVLIDGCFTEYPVHYKYRWLFENEGYSIGNIIDEHSITNGHDLVGLFENIVVSEFFFNEISKKCFQYAEINHNIVNVTDLFLIGVRTCSNKLHLNFAYLLRMYKFQFFKFLHLADKKWTK